MDDSIKLAVADNESMEKKNKITSEMLKVLLKEQVTVSEAISILGIAKEKILKSRINLLNNH